MSPLTPFDRVTSTPDTEEEALARIEITKIETVAKLDQQRLDADHKRSMERFRTRVTYLGAGFALLVAGVGAGCVLALGPEGLRPQALLVLSSLATGVTGFFFGRTSAKD